MLLNYKINPIKNLLLCLKIRINKWRLAAMMETNNRKNLNNIFSSIKSLLLSLKIRMNKWRLEALMKMMNRKN